MEAIKDALAGLLGRLLLVLFGLLELIEENIILVKRVWRDIREELWVR